ncbi:MAG: hypothetical protein JSR77_10685, partial [Planctomycetes bacterium]|nr:hypothetical protein [Planctomycetota bacterium]
VVGGSLQFYGSGTQSGSFQVDSSASLLFSDTHSITSGATFTGAGLVGIEGGSSTFGPGVSIPVARVNGGTLIASNGLTITGTLSLLGGTIAAAGVLSTQAFSISGGAITGEGSLTLAGASSISGGTLANTGEVHFAGVTTWSAGTFSGTGRAYVDAGAQLLLTGAATNQRVLSRELINNGSLTWTNDGDLAFNNGTLINNGAMLIDSNVSTPAAFRGGGSALLRNNGTITKRGLAAFTTATDLSFDNPGILAVEGGAVTIGATPQVSGTTVFGGDWRISGGGSLAVTNVTSVRAIVAGASLTLADSGAFSAVSTLATLGGSLNLENAGGRTLTPFGGTLTSTGSLRTGRGSTLNLTGAFATTGTLTAQLAGANTSGRVVATGGASAAGALVIELAPGFVPGDGDSFAILSGATRSGTFSQVTFPPANLGINFSTSYTATQVRIETAAGVPGIWTGAGDGRTWSQAENWAGGVVPGPGTDVFISVPGSPTILINENAAARSITSDEAISVLGGARLEVTSGGLSTINAPFRVLDGELIIDPSATMTVLGAFVNADQVLVHGTLEMFGGGVQTGTFTLDPSATIDLGRTHTFAATSGILAASGAVLSVSSGTATFSGSIAPMVDLAVASRASVNLAVSYTLRSVTNSGLLNLQSNTLSVTGNYTQTSTGTLVIDLLTDSRFGNLSAAGDVSLNGTLTLTNSAGFDPSNPSYYFFTLTLITGAHVNGDFFGVDAFAPAAGSFLVRREGNAVNLLHNIADFNNDGGIDSADVEAFFYAWESGFAWADANGDGGIDAADVEAFFATWEVGGR